MTLLTSPFFDFHWILSALTNSDYIIPLFISSVFKGAIWFSVKTMMLDLRALVHCIEKIQSQLFEPALQLQQCQAESCDGRELLELILIALRTRRQLMLIKCNWLELASTKDIWRWLSTRLIRLQSPSSHPETHSRVLSLYWLLLNLQLALIGLDENDALISLFSTGLWSQMGGPVRARLGRGPHDRLQIRLLHSQQCYVHLTVSNVNKSINRSILIKFTQK